MSPGKSSARGSRPANGNGADLLGVNSEIGRKLKQYYDGLVTEKVPERFAELLSKLEQAETTKRVAARRSEG